jgi:hypothetical protein
MTFIQLNTLKEIVEINILNEIFLIISLYK